MPIIRNELGANSKGGTELMMTGLEERLSSRSDLLDFIDIYPSRVRNFDTTRPSLFWAHDLPGDPESDQLKPDGGKRFNLMVFVSHWQQQQYQAYYNLAGHNHLVLPNAIEPFETDVMSKWQDPLGSETNPIRLIYHTTPHRGLELLVPAFEAAYQQCQQQGVHITLDVYSSFSIYGWEQRDTPYEGIFERCRKHPGINYHGAVPNADVRQALRLSHIFAYPSTWQETSCIALIEAMAAGCIALHSNLAALPETSGGLTVAYAHTPDMNAHLQRFYGVLMATIGQLVSDFGSIAALPAISAQRANLLYDWDYRINQWISALEAVKSKVDIIHL